MMQEAVVFLLDIVLQSFAAILLLRFHLQWLRAPLHNPIGEFVMVFTDFIVLRARRYIPSAWGYDSATLLLALIVETLYLFALGWVLGDLHGFPLLGLLVLAAVKLFKISVYLLLGAVIIQAVLSWINPHTPISSVLNSITWRFLQPLRSIIPTVGNIDLSSLVLFVICQLILIVPVGMMENFAIRLI